jgi:hypothetical protein
VRIFEAPAIVKMRIILAILFFSALTAAGQPGKSDSCHFFLDTLTNQQVLKFLPGMPRVQGGMEEVSKEISKRIKYPHIDRYPMDTKVIVAFIITEDGRVTGKRVIKDFSGFGEQLLDILDDFKWDPGTCNGKSVSTLQVFPMIIEISK